MAAAPDVIATANVGCALHLAGRATVPVVHWIELLEGEPEDA
jgi:glycolate oxidase iron-sulfur subunit